ncbi:SusC/RagA family TonB-linked outer membrane protein [Flavobacterium sp.]|uniref:SusC/RagA family TonB-linked outer membrane protein n=1 Tax=Flavobacterium sp. TaxID=239 RepID=UPI0025F955F1|nr:SusC/RagA family TonB-linked outer membrane protein [Flavobacterium sp.]
MRSKFKWIFTLLLALSMQFSFAQEKTVTGVVSDNSGPVPGANVVVKGTTRSTQTDFDGKYSIKAKAGEVLVISYVGSSDARVTVGAANNVNVKLQEGVELAEVVIQTNLGYFKKDANKVTSSISTVSGEEFTKQTPSLAFTNALQGKAAGVQVTARNGMPGQGAYVTIRGNVSITGGYAGAAYVVDGAYVSESEASAIAPGDIETVSVIKDAAAAALYGAKGGNGVVVITTRRGKTGSKAKFEITNSIGYTERLKDPFDMMTTAQKLQYEQDLGEGPGFDATPAQLAILQSFDHNWQNTLLRHGALQNFSFSVSGGTEKTSNFFSLGYNKDTGIIKGIKGYNKITAAFNSDYQATDYFKFGFSVRGSYETNTLPRDRYNSQNPFAAMMWYNGYEPEFDSDPDTGELVLDADGNPTYNLTHTGFPIGEALRNNPEETRFFRSYVRPYIELKLLKGLTFNTSFAINYERYQREYFNKPGSVLDGYVGDPTAPGSKTDNGYDNIDMQWTNTANYKFKIGENHNFDVRGLYDYTYSNFRSYAATRKGFAGDYPTAGTIPTAATSGRSEEAAYAILGVVDYDYKGKYLLSVSGRNDWSSLLGANTNNIFAKAGSIGWVVSKESFFKFKPITFLKLRASLGQLNSTNGAVRYGNISTYVTTNYGGGIGTVYNNDRIGNTSLRFEQVEKLDLGFETRLFKDYIALTASYFKDKRKAFLFADVTTPGEELNVTRNAGDWEAKGFEIELKAFAIKSQDVNLSFYVNAAKFDRHIIKLNDPTTEAIRGFTINRIGYSPDSFYLVRYAGVDSTNGDALYYDVNGAVTNVYSANDRVLLDDKTPYAKYEGGFGMEFEFKGFDVSTDFVFKEGNYTYNLRYRDLLTDGVSIADNQAAAALDYWTPTNTDASQPAPLQLSGVDNNQDSTRFLEDASYIRFRNLNFGYTFGKKLLKNLPLDKVRIYTQMQNLHTWSKFNGDPEIGIGNGESGTAIPGTYAGYSYPTVKSVLFGLTINF